MLTWSRLFIACFCLSVTTVTAMAAEPAMTLRIQPIIKMTPALKHVMLLADQEEVGVQFAQLIETFAEGDNGFEGIDLKKPIGAYVKVSENIEQSSVVIMIPLANDKAFLELLSGKAGLDPRKGDGDIYSIDIPQVPFPVYFRFTNGYIYITIQNEAAIDPKQVIAPKDFFAKQGAELMAMQFRLSEIPTDVANGLIGQLEMQLAQDLDNKNDAAEKALVKFGGNVLIDMLKQILSGSDNLAIALDLQPKADLFDLMVKLTPKAGSTLQKSIQAFGNRPSIAAGITQVNNPAIAFALNTVIPPEMRKDLDGLVELLGEKAVAEAKNSDVFVVQKVVDVLMPTLKAKSVELGAVVTSGSTPKQIEIAVALRTEKGKGIEALAKELAPFIPEEELKFAFDVEKIGGRVLHKVMPTAAAPAMFTTNVVNLLTSDDLFVLSSEPKTAKIKGIATAKAVEMPMLSLQVSFVQFLQFATENLSAEDAKNIVTRVFGEAGYAERDRLTLTATGGKDFTIRVQLNGRGAIFAANVDELNK